MVAVLVVGSIILEANNLLLGIWALSCSMFLSSVASVVGNDRLLLKVVLSVLLSLPSSVRDLLGTLNRFLFTTWMTTAVVQPLLFVGPGVLVRFDLIVGAGGVRAILGAGFLASLVPTVVSALLILSASVTCLSLVETELPSALAVLLRVFEVTNLLTVLVSVRTDRAPLLVCRTVTLILLSLLETFENVLPTPARVLVVEHAVPTALPPAWKVLIPVRRCREVRASPLLRLRRAVNRVRRLPSRAARLSWWASVLCVRLL